MKLPAVNCGIPTVAPAGIINHKNAMQMAGIACSNHRGGTRRRCPEADTVDFSWFASINGLVSGSDIVGRDVRVVEVGLAELIIGNHGNGTEAPLPSRNDGRYKRSGDKGSVNKGRRCFSFSVVAPDANSAEVHVRIASRLRWGRAPRRNEQKTRCIGKSQGVSVVMRSSLSY